MPPSDYAYGQAAVPPRKSGMTTPGKVLFFLGLLLSLVAVAVAVWGVTSTVRTASTMQADAIQVQQDTATTVPMEADRVRLILADPGTEPSCTVAAPNGQDVPVSQDPAFDAAAQEGLVVVGTFTAQTAGEHTVTCDAPAMISPSLGLSDVTGIVAAGIAFLALFPLVLLTLLGLVLWLVGRNRDKKAALAASGYGTGPGGYGTDAGGYDPRGYDPRGGYQDTPPPGSGGWQSSPPPPPGPSSDPYAAPRDPDADRDDDQR